MNLHALANAAKQALPIICIAATGAYAFEAQAAAVNNPYVGAPSGGYAVPGIGPGAAVLPTPPRNGRPADMAAIPVVPSDLSTRLELMGVRGDVALLAIRAKDEQVIVPVEAGKKWFFEGIAYDVQVRTFPAPAVVLTYNKEQAAVVAYRNAVAPQEAGQGTAPAPAVTNGVGGMLGAHGAGSGTGSSNAPGFSGGGNSQPPGIARR